MFARRISTLACVVLAAGLSGGCKPKAPTARVATQHYFQTPFQTESEYLVHAIVTDLAEQMTYAASRRVPDPAQFNLAVAEKPGSPPDAPVYAIEVRLDAKSSAVRTELPVNGLIWSPAVYQKIAAELARSAGVKSGATRPSSDTALLSKLTDSSPETIERENQSLSAALEKDFQNPGLHEQAALLIGAFLLRDHSGNFYDIRSPLCRMTAHLTMAGFLRGTEAPGVNGRLAEAMLLSLVNAQVPALEQLNTLGTNDVTVAAMARALRARTTGDYRALNAFEDLTPIEDVARFVALADFVSPSIAWPKLSSQQKETIDYIRAANQLSYSVEIGHQLLQAAIPLELEEIQAVYALAREEELPDSRLITALNELPERCLTASAGAPRVRIIGWGQWALFLQRHLCHAIQQNFQFMDRKWGVPDDAKEFARECERQYHGLRLYPFVRRFNCTDVTSYHKSVDDGFTVTVATPHLVPSECWNRLCAKVRFALLYTPNPNPHVNEWHNHNPLPGTVYDLGPRLDHPSLVHRPDVVQRMEQLHELSPHDGRIISFLIEKKYKNQLSYEQALTLYRSMLPYSMWALRTVAWAAWNQPDLYTKTMLQAVVLDPSAYYDLGDYEDRRGQRDKAAEYYDRACAEDPDSVRASRHALWRVSYYCSKGQRDKAAEIADAAAETYSARGLESKALFFELSTNYDTAFEWYSKIEERYPSSSDLVKFCLRHRAATGDKRFEPEIKRCLKKLFPKGIQKVALGDFQAAPAEGVLIRQENELLKTAGLKAGDVIVALDGVRVGNLMQFLYVRDGGDAPELSLIVWQGGAYREVKSSPPRRRFGVDMGDYQPPSAAKQ